MDLTAPSALLALVSPLRFGTLAQTTTGNPSFTGACADDPSAVCEKVKEWTGSAFWASAAEWFVARPLQVALIVVVAWVANRIAHVLIKRGMTRLLDPDRMRARRVLRKATPVMLQKTSEVGMRTDARTATLTTVFRSLASIAIWFIAGIAILGVFDVDLAPIIAAASVFGVALGFGAQNIVRDFLAGTFMVVEDQFGVGDVVDLGEAKGTVEEITLRATRVRDVNGTLWHVPNGQILRVANKSQAWSRAVLDLEMDGGTSYDAAAEVIQHTADHLSADPGFATDIIDTPEVWGIEAFTERGYTIRLVIKTRPAAQFRVMRELRIRLTDAFREAGITTAGGGRPELWVHDGDRPPGEGNAAVPAPSLPAESGSTPSGTDPDHQREPAKGDPSEG
jgi:small-conductance mechanosensitive channel